MLKIYIILFVKCLLINFGATQLEIGDACVVAGTGAEGTCKIITDCPAAIEDLKNNRGDLTNRSYFGNSQIVCCANPILQTTTPPTSNRISAKKCEEYKELNYDITNDLDLATGQRIPKKTLNCSIVHFNEQFIFGKTVALAKEFPHMALIGHGEPEDIQWFCGGSLISERFVLTAGHCLMTGNQPAKYVKLGDLRLNTTSDDAKSVEVEIAERIPHPKFIRAIYYFDIALLRLATDIQFNQYIRPICLPQTLESGTSKAMATGWSPGAWRSDKGIYKLLKALLDYFTYEECNNHYDMHRLLPAGVNNSLQVCAGSHTNSEGTCTLNTGGPLQIYHSHSCMYEIVGIGSFGKNCRKAGIPDVFTRVFSYLDWIESQVWPNKN